MNLHSGARTCPASRALLVERVREHGWTVTRTAEAAGISRRTAHKWLTRHQSEDPTSLRDRSSRPRRSPNRTPVEWQQIILLLRRTKMTGPQIARDLRRPRATVARVLKRAGLERLKQLEPREPENRYQHRRPGDLLHLDVKKLGRISGFHGHRITGDRSKRRVGAGWDYVHVAIDDRTRIAYAEVLRDETAETAALFLRRALAWYRTLGIRVRRILTDNGTGYLAAQVPGYGPEGMTGRVGVELSVDQGRRAAERAALNALGRIHEALGGFDRLVGLLHVAGHVASADDFRHLRGTKPE